MDHVTSLLVLYAEVKTKKPKPLTIQLVAQEEGKGSLQEIKQTLFVAFPFSEFLLLPLYLSSYNFFNTDVFLS